MLRSFFHLPLLVILTTAFAVPAAAQSGALSQPDAPSGIVMVVREVGHARAALKTAAALRDGARFEAVPIEVVVCGGASRALLRGADEAEGLVAEAARNRVRLLACGMSLASLGIDAADLSAGIGVVENGLLHALERQADGFLSVEL